jgi:hypothetical protein
MSSIRINGELVDESKVTETSLANGDSKHWPITAIKVVAWLDLVFGFIGALALLMNRDILHPVFFALLSAIQALFFWAFLLVVAGIASDVKEIRTRR